MKKEIRTKLGVVSGIERENHVLFLGIPYAQAPVGNNRFRAPVEIKPWDGVLKCDTVPNSAVQKQREFGSFYEKEFGQQSTSSEDCLYLNIWMPKSCEKAKMPVAFYIHGGAFLSGSGSEPQFDTDAYAKRGVVLVTIQYRLSVFGFLSHPWLKKETGQSGNYAILDQLCALKWVYENIEVFGGNPENITVFGQSAGAMSTQALVSSELSGNMIKKAIMQSGGGIDGGFNEDFTEAEAIAIGEKFVKLLGVNNLEELRKASVDHIMKAAREVIGFGFQTRGGLVFQPTIDGYVLKGSANQLLHNGTIKKIPYILGSTSEDMDITPEMHERHEHGKLYYGPLNWAKESVKCNPNNVWIYYFTHQLPGDDAGAFHSSELWYMFGTVEKCWRPMVKADVVLSEKILDEWTSFMKTGEPSQAWRAYNENDPYIQQFD